MQAPNQWQLDRRSARATAISSLMNKNAAFFSTRFPALYQQLTTDPGLTLETTVDAQGAVAIRFGDQVFTEQALIEEANAKIRAFAENRGWVLGISHVLNSSPIEFLRRFVGEWYEVQLSAAVHAELEAAFNRQKKAGAKVTEMPRFGRRHFPVVLSLGVGIGIQLDKLESEFQVDHLLIVDTDPNLFRLSWMFFDWQAFIERVEQSGRTVTIYYSRDYEDLATAVVTAVEREAPPIFVHGMRIFPALRVSNVSDRAVPEVTRLVDLRIGGAGFIEDEFVALQNTLAHVRHGVPFFRQPKTPAGKTAAFVVGAGPSLDGLIDLIRQNRDQALVISCGSALRALYRAGIKPDIHVEVERLAASADVNAANAPAEWVADIPLVAANCVHPQMLSRYTQNFVVHKATDSGVRLVMSDPSVPIVPTGPTVVNAGVSLCLALGIDTVYLAGADFGFVDPERHHSRNTLYFDREGITDQFAQQIEKGVITTTFVETYEVPGNLRDTVLTDPIFDRGRTVMGIQLTDNAAVKVFNLNDGARIDGAIPLRKEEFALPSGLEDKGAVLERIFASFAPYSTEEISARIAAFDRDAEAYVQQGKAILQAPMTDRASLLDRITALWNFAAGAPYNENLAGVYFGGSFRLHIQWIHEYAACIGRDDQALAYARESFAAVARFLDLALAEVRKLWEPHTTH